MVLLPVPPSEGLIFGDNRPFNYCVVSRDNVLTGGHLLYNSSLTKYIARPNVELQCMAPNLFGEYNKFHKENPIGSSMFIYVDTDTERSDTERSEALDKDYRAFIKHSTIKVGCAGMVNLPNFTSICGVGHEHVVIKLVTTFDDDSKLVHTIFDKKMDYDTHNFGCQIGESTGKIGDVNYSTTVEFSLRNPFPLITEPSLTLFTIDEEKYLEEISK